MINMEEDLVNDVSVLLAYMQETSIEGCRKKGAILRLIDAMGGCRCAIGN